MAKSRKRYFDLIAYLTHDGMPDDFLIITGRSTECGGGIDFSMHIRQMIFDVAFIQNISDKPFRSTGMLGSEVPATGCAPPDRRSERCRRSDRPSSGELMPGGTIAVPLAISFIMADSLKQPFERCRPAPPRPSRRFRRRNPAPFSN